MITVKIRKQVKTIDQSDILNQWFGIARIYYNQAILRLKENHRISFYSLRKELIDKLKIQFPYSEDTPYDIRANAIKDAYITIMNGIKKAIKERKFIEYKFREKKDLNQSIFIPKHSVKENGIYVRILKEMNMSESIQTVDGDCRLCYKRNNGYYLSIPQKSKTKTSSDIPKKFATYCAIDPGIRTFATCYTRKGVFEIGVNDCKRIDRLNYHLDKLQSEINKSNAKKKAKLRKASQKMRDKIKNIVKELHWKTSKFLCVNFKKIFIPEFKTQDMVIKKDRKINKKTVRNMMTWSHYLFRQRLIHQAKKYGSDIYIVNESYTSKTCSHCGHINEKLGGSKTFKCAKCEIRMDRDVNGARNILIRQLSL